MRFSNQQEHRFVPYVMTVPSLSRPFCIAGTRSQVPLLPAWALTVHRSQGMSLASCHVHMCGFSAHGQPYVAMSRATTREGLRITGCNNVSDLPKPSGVVSNFYANLGTCATGQEAPGNVLPAGEGSSFSCCKGAVCAAACDTSTVTAVLTGDEPDVEDSAVNIDAVLESLDEPDLTSESVCAVGPLDLFTTEVLDSLLSSCQAHSAEYNAKIEHLVASLRTASVATSSFFSWVHVCLSKLLEQALAQPGQRTRLTTYAGHIHTIFSWPQLKKHWQGLLKVVPVSLELDDEFSSSALTMAVFECNTALLNRAGSTEAEEISDTSPPTCVMPSDNLGIIRHCGGWAVHKVISAASNYVVENIFSENTVVRREVAHQKELKAAAEMLVTTAASASCHTAYPNTLQTTAEIDRGALTFVNDPAFTFFVALEQKCSSVFDLRTTEQFREKTLSHAHETIEGDATLLAEFANVLTGAAASTGASMIKSVTGLCFTKQVTEQERVQISAMVIKDLYTKTTRRYINMRMGRWLKDLRETLRVEKTEALRKRQSLKETREQKAKLTQVIESDSPEAVSEVIKRSTVSELALLSRAALRRAFSLFPGISFRLSQNRIQLATTLFSFVKQRSNPSTADPESSRQTNSST